MRISRIFTKNDLNLHAEVSLDNDTSHYLLKVLRLKTGSPLILFNGDGYQYQCELVSADRKIASIQIVEQSEKEKPPVLNIHLGIGLSKGDRLDFAFQKATELGVSEITPLFTEYATLKLNAERLKKKTSHWQGIIHSACEQSGRCYLPKLHPPRSVNKWLHEHFAGLMIVLSPDESQTMDSYSAPQNLTILIGPEGGLSEDEVAMAIEQGFIATRLGKHVLRTETAPLAVISAAQALWGDFRG
ncbi:MAG: 16S rRNA (uracil(1498)-N(3))-methyltransferase [Gammaproteobacteria bacterium]|nr:16S rRNA (uracil(1498)-N(3))-methyltransferase [Gammaproteobacteria bacterium]